MLTMLPWLATPWPRHYQFLFIVRRAQPRQTKSTLVGVSLTQRERSKSALEVTKRMKKCLWHESSLPRCTAVVFMSSEFYMARTKLYLAGCQTETDETLGRQKPRISNRQTLSARLWVRELFTEEYREMAIAEVWNIWTVTCETTNTEIWWMLDVAREMRTHPAGQTVGNILIVIKLATFKCCVHLNGFLFVIILV